METKTCKACGTEKPVSEYYTRNKNRVKNGTAYIYVWVPTTCSACEDKQRLDYAKTPEGKEAAKRAYTRRYADPEKRAKILEYQRSEKGKENRMRYQHSEHGRAKRAEYMASEHGHKLASKRWTKHRANRREAVEATAGRKLSARNWRTILRAYEGHCAYCDTTEGQMQPDHVIPLSKGGTHNKSNIVPACYPCNEKKKDAVDWRPNPPRIPLSF